MRATRGLWWAVALRCGAVLVIGLALVSASLGISIGLYYMLPFNVAQIGLGVAVWMLSRRLTAGWTRLAQMEQRLEALRKP